MINNSNGKYIDLHTHSTASDGSMAPDVLVRHAYGLGLSAIALTDHDTLDGAGLALEEGKRLGMEVIPGVEISVTLSSWDLPPVVSPRSMQESKSMVCMRPEMHLLGYFFSGNYSLLSDTLSELRDKREQRNPKIIKKLNELGFDITLGEAAAKAGGGMVGRPHIARALMEKGYISSIAEGFNKYLAAGRPAYVEKDKLTPEEGITEIIRAGGVPVLAHPIYLGLKGTELGKVLEKLKAAGLRGIEALYTENTQEQTEELLKLAAEYGLKVTGGSDFHGSFKPGIEAGTGRGNLRVPYDLLLALREE